VPDCRRRPTLTPVPLVLSDGVRPRRILLHPGFPGTGGDSLRRFLWANHAALAPCHSLILQRALEPAVACARAFSQGLNPLVLADLVAVMDGIIAGAGLRPGTDLILSADGLTGQIPGRHGVTDHSAAPVIASFLAGYLADRFPGAELAVVCTTRNAADWQAALQAATGARTDAAVLAAVDLDADVAALAQALDPVAVYALPFEEARSHPLGIGGAFLELADLPDAVRASLVPINPG
jgi:hypothetical protein